MKSLKKIEAKVKKRLHAEAAPSDGDKEIIKTTGTLFRQTLSGTVKFVEVKNTDEKTTTHVFQVLGFTGPLSSIKNFDKEMHRKIKNLVYVSLSARPTKPTLLKVVTT